jgi:hypothetical protein
LTADRKTRQRSKPSDFNYESYTNAITISPETSHLKPPTAPKRPSNFSVLPKRTTRSSAKTQQSLGYEGIEILEAASSGAKHPSTIGAVDMERDKTQHEEGIPALSKSVNAQLFEDCYQRFIRGCYGDAEELDGDDGGCRNSSSDQDGSIKKPVMSDPHSAKSNHKRQIDESSKDQATDSEDNENTRKRPPKRPRKTAEEKQAELRCTEFAARRQTTAKCLTYSTKNLHRLKSVSPVYLDPEPLGYSSYRKSTP